MTEVPAETDSPCVSVPFAVVEWDDEANLSPQHLSYVIHILLPERLVSLDRDINIEAQFKAFCEEKRISNAVAVGSTAEGFNIPYSMSIEKESQLYTHTDADVLLVEKDLQISTRDPIKDAEIQATMESSEVHPGYTRVCLQKYAENPRDVVIINDKKYLSAQAIQNRMHKNIISGGPKDDQRSIFVHGPAVSVEYSTVLNAENIQTYGMRIDLDMVYAVRVKQWPSEATKWVERAKQRRWLDNDLIESVVLEGCHVVPVAHKESLNPEVEWRISFATTEKQIARKVVTDAQRQCYIYFKMLRYLCLKDLGVLFSYCLKTVFFYACEVIPKSQWEENIGLCLLYLLDSLIGYVKRRNIPSFFIPENNLVDNVPEQQWQEVEARLIEIRKDPITPILKFTDTNVISNHGIPFVFRENIAYVLEDMEKFKLHRDINKSAFDAFFTTSFRMSLILLDRGKPKDAVQMLMDSYPVINRYLGPMPLPYYFNEVSILIQDSRLSLLLVQELFGMTDQYPEFDQFKANLACAYHAASHTYPEKSSERVQYLQEAEKLIQDEINAQGSSSCGTLVAYATILMSQKKYKETIRILESVANEAGDNSKEEIQSDITEYGFSEQICLDSDLQSEISNHMKIEGPSLIFAFYFLAKCLLQENEKAKLVSLFVEYQKLCELCDDVTGYKLLGYSFYQVGEKQKAKGAFEAALQKMPGSKLLKTNIEKCSPSFRSTIYTFKDD